MSILCPIDVLHTIMENILEFLRNDESIGLVSRMPKQGPELELVQDFVIHLKENLNLTRKNYALFYEPLMPTGFPDIVVVTYNPKLYDKWNSSRSNISILDMKILHHLYYVKKCTSNEISKQLCLDKGVILGSIERLLDAKLINRLNGYWCPKSLQTTYAVSNLQTIEAKIGNTKEVLEQASNNRWFASESCVLLPSCSLHERSRSKAKNLGIGIWGLSKNNNNFRIIQKPVRVKSPASYASWFFNEWIGRKLFQS